jgi:hypothetical protein
MSLENFQATHSCTAIHKGVDYYHCTSLSSAFAHGTLATAVHEHLNFFTTTHLCHEHLPAA